MNPDISEFSYGYALTESLINWIDTPLSAAPIFPSLIAEGRSGGGYDLRLDLQGFPLFVQFKLSDYIKGRNAREFRLGFFSTPFYRMHLRPLKHSQQHQLLLDLAQEGYEVYYAAPAFHTSEELNSVYLAHRVIENSVFVPPLAIGELPDVEEHHVAFQLSGRAYLLSSPRSVFLLNGRDFDKKMSIKLKEAMTGGYKLSFSLLELSKIMLEIVNARIKPQRSFWEQNENKFDDLPLLRKISYLARTFFDSEVLIVRHKEEMAEKKAA